MWLSAGRLHVPVLERIADVLDTRDKLDQEAVRVAQPEGTFDARFEIRSGWGDDVDAAREESSYARSMSSTLGTCSATWWRPAASAFGQREDVVIGTVGPEEHLAAKLVNPLETPAVVVELSLRTQAARLQAHVGEPGHLHHRPPSSSATVIYGKSAHRCAFVVLMQVCRRHIPARSTRQNRRVYRRRAWRYKYLECTGRDFDALACMQPPVGRRSVLATSTPTISDMTQRARDLLPTLRERAATTEALGHLPPETVADFREGGFFRVLQPRRFGGMELDYGRLQAGALQCPRSGLRVSGLGADGRCLPRLVSGDVP